MLDHAIKVLVIEKDIKWVKEFTNYLDRIKDIKITGEARNIEEGLKNISYLMCFKKKKLIALISQK